jgi:hypothetical protein
MVGLYWLQIFFIDQDRADSNHWSPLVYRTQWKQNLRLLIVAIENPRPAPGRGPGGPGLKRRQGGQVLGFPKPHRNFMADFSIHALFYGDYIK